MINLGTSLSASPSGFADHISVANAPVWLVVAARPLKLEEYKCFNRHVS
jgi:hypothetical protein